MLLSSTPLFYVLCQYQAVFLQRLGHGSNFGDLLHPGPAEAQVVFHIALHGTNRDIETAVTGNSLVTDLDVHNTSIKQNLFLRLQSPDVSGTIPPGWASSFLSAFSLQTVIAVHITFKIRQYKLFKEGRDLRLIDRFITNNTALPGKFFYKWNNL